MQDKLIYLLAGLGFTPLLLALEYVYSKWAGRRAAAANLAAFNKLLDGTRSVGYIDVELETTPAKKGEN